MFYSKSFQELVDESIRMLAANTSITNFSPGSIARALLEVINTQLARCYTTLDFNLTMAFVSTARGNFLDLIGELLDCHRYDGESDDNYRYRITNQVYVAAGANETAIRLRLLSVKGVHSVIFKEFTFGTGSFTAYIIPETGYDTDLLMNAVQAQLDDAKAFGIKAVAMMPREIPVDVSIRLMFEQSVTAQERAYIADQVSYEVRRYIENLPVGGELVINEIIRRAIDVDSDAIRDVSIYKFAVNGRPALLVNQNPEWDERIVPGQVVVS